MTKSEIKDLDFHIKADLGYGVGNGEHWKSRYEGKDFVFIEFSRLNYSEITAHLLKMTWNESEDDFYDGVETLKSENLGEWNNSDFANKAEAFANKCGF